MARATFSVYAVDAANNADPTPATWTFTVGVVPDTTIDSAVDGLNNGVSNGGTDPTDSITFTFSGTDNNPSNGLTFTCELTGPSPFHPIPAAILQEQHLVRCLMARHILRICSGCCQQR